MNDSELYNRVIRVDIAKPHRGLAGLDNTLPGMLVGVTVLMVVWQQEEWIKANAIEKSGDKGGKEAPDAMEGLELAAS
jgi:hypothetical protein